ncbi:MAG: FtsQ-type POTRA domain-containing protein [Candidatus Moraniibacteriota bacterium]
MWFSSKKNKLKHREKGSVPFLRKALPEHKERRVLEKKTEGRNIWGILLLWVVFLGTFVYLFFFSSFILIEKVQILGTNELSEQKVQKFVEDQLIGKQWKFFPKRGYMVVQLKDFETRLRNEFPLLATVSVERIFPNSLRVFVTEQKKIIIWKSSGVSYLVDNDGVTHDSAKALSPENEAYILTLTDTSNKPVAEGERVLDMDYRTFLIDMNQSFFERLGLRLETEYTIVSRFADELRAKTDEGWDVYFSTTIPAETSLSTLSLLFEKELPKEKRVNLLYIDLRAENRAYYTFRDGTNMEVIPTAVTPDAQKQSNKKDTKKK